MRLPSLLLTLLTAIAAVSGGHAETTVPAPSGPLVLDKVVLLSRHGVRSPTKPPEDLRRHSDQDWHPWPVAPGILTPHGADALRSLGAYLGRHYAAAGLLATTSPAARCPAPDAVFVWGDSGDQRTRASAQALADGLGATLTPEASGCAPLTAHSRAADSKDVLFDAAAGGACPMDPQAAHQALLAASGGDPGRVPPAVAPALAALARMVAPRSCGGEHPGAACFATGPSRVVDKGGEVKIDGPLARGAMLAESLYLEYVQGFPADEVAWGRGGSPAALAAILPVHDYQADLTRRTAYPASHNGALLLRQIGDALQGAAPGDTAREAPVPAAARLVAIMGHDTNLSNVAGALGLDWTLPDQPDKTAPDTTLAFETLRDTATGQRFVQVALYYQSLDDLRTAAPLTAHHPAGRVALSLPACGGALCRLEDVTRLLRDAIPAECRP